MGKTKYFFDFEFNPYNITMISVGIVCEDGREYYAESITGYYTANENSWLRDNVLPYLGKVVAKPQSQMRDEILEFCTGEPQFWAWYGAYDWVLMTRLIGNHDFQNTPPNWPKYHMDLKQWSKQLGIDQLPDKLQPEHHALSDARWNKLVWEFLNGKN